jgi:hypothetical protein
MIAGGWHFGLRLKVEGVVKISWTAGFQGCAQSTNQGEADDRAN